MDVILAALQYFIKHLVNRAVSFLKLNTSYMQIFDFDKHVVALLLRRSLV